MPPGVQVHLQINSQMSLEHEHLRGGSGMINGQEETSP